ncbi:NFACT family protein [Bacillus haynesii]|uniref:Rqc2 family fibronectin-binding protein n=1 Tax=Bacillus haynesii TaxID=1925021 RepID=UPI002280AB3A|nr:NFACT RNA binding domain-containing protein [Bacillus haynesii]MCY7815834.1 NFACT RNA binding domain-containing protein [Bacillus haynesii]MCY8240514.1 NFACT RNA binding domain-containing protein [Bacillus haynesii]MCY8569887.1 NFACT RNA binding domain-containing protein [Bacillus haynesii]MCY8661444.1 NFACT RNA binding domain-containing protein [Bacillus haynesii]
MSFDGIFTYGMIEELNETIRGGRIAKIHQPFKHELVFHIRANGQNRKLLLSAHPSYARVHLTHETYDNPSTPPMFCMLLRKHLEGGFIDQVEQIGMDRMMVFHIRSRNEIGDTLTRKLMVEIMGRHSNIVLTDGEKDVIIDSLKHLSPSVNSYRTVLPGYDYILPPAQNKLSPLEAETEDILRHLNFQEGKLDKQIVDTFSGVSPLFAKEAVFRAGLANRATLPSVLTGMFSEVKNRRFQPQLVTTEDGKEYFYLLELTHIKGDNRPFHTLSELLDRYYFGKAERDRVKQQAHDLERFAANEKKKNENKIKKLKKTLEQSEHAKDYQLYGELLTANLYQLKKGDKEAKVINYYDENGGEITIPLNPNKTPSENAQSYFTKYQKAKNSVDVVKEQIRLAEEEIAYFDQLIQQLSSASPKDITEIREELAEGKYLRAKQQGGQKKQKKQAPTLEAYESSAGETILVGKNNKQNEYLTMKLAARDHIWLHTKDIPGSHVVIQSSGPDEQTILEAAQIAAYYSKAKNSASVPVDYTKIRHVKKPNGAKPGFVTYDSQQTVFVTPDEDLIIKLKK